MHTRTKIALNHRGARVRQSTHYYRANSHRLKAPYRHKAAHTRMHTRGCTSARIKRNSTQLQTHSCTAHLLVCMDACNNGMHTRARCLQTARGSRKRCICTHSACQQRKWYAGRTCAHHTDSAQCALTAFTRSKVQVKCIRGASRHACTRTTHSTHAQRARARAQTHTHQHYSRS